MDGRILGSIVFLIRAFAAGIELLSYLQQRVRPDQFGSAQSAQVYFVCAFWVTVAVLYHVIVFANPTSTNRVKSWMANPAGAGIFAVVSALGAFSSLGSSLLFWATLENGAIMPHRQDFANIAILAVCLFALFMSPKPKPITPQ